MTPLQLHREPLFRFRRWPAAWKVFVCAVGAMALSVVVMAVDVAYYRGRTSKALTRSAVDTATVTAKQYAYEAFPAWVASHPDRECPVCLHELNEYMSYRYSVQDPWSNEYQMRCTTRGLVVVSFGPDGVPGTTDDIASDE